jgi:cellulose synthase/poly-beta-1,6-N-acetylglucosamine synthase-like glycosyltransferase
VNPVTISVIIPAYNASPSLAKTLKALSKQNCFQPYEVIVVDDGSTDNTAKIVEQFEHESPHFFYIYQNNAGPAAARNHGAHRARGEFLVFTDSDCIPHPNWLSKLMEGFGRPQVGVVAGSYGIANPESRLSRCIYMEILWRHQHLMPDFPNSFGSYNFCIRREVFEAVGGFNTGYRNASGEDNDLSYKVRRAGWKIYFERKALVDHYHTVKVVKYLKEQFRHGFWRVKMYLDHPGMMKGDGYTFWKDILEMPLSILFLGLAVLSAFNFLRFGNALFFCGCFFLAFEILSALVMMRNFFDGIFLGFIFFLRAISRFLGFSTGILPLLLKKKSENFSIIP